jgi:hypothetical protein
MRYRLRRTRRLTAAAGFVLPAFVHDGLVLSISIMARCRG